MNSLNTLNKCISRENFIFPLSVEKQSYIPQIAGDCEHKDNEIDVIEL